MGVNCISAIVPRQEGEAQVIRWHRNPQGTRSGLRWRRLFRCCLCQALPVFCLVITGISCPAAAVPAGDPPLEETGKTQAKETPSGLFLVKVTTARVGLYTPADPDGPKRIGRLRFVGGLQVHGHDERFGGFSGLVVAPDRSALLAVSDHGFWMRADIVGDAAGRPADLVNVAMAPIRDWRGDPVEPVGEDAEAIARSEGRLGPRLLVSFEHWHRVWSYPLIAGGSAPFLGAMLAPATPLRLPRKTLRHPANGGIEAMVELTDGRLLLFSEKDRLVDSRLTAWLVDPAGGRASPLSLVPIADGFAPSDAARLPNGDLLLLERRYRALEGPSAAIVRIARDDIRAGAVLHGEELARLVPPVTLDNYEALDVAIGPDGRTWLYLMSDDNYRRTQRTLLMVFSLEEGAGAAPAGEKESARSGAGRSSEP
ncbi:MAG: hypothetical protein D6757_07030 [Alphaproteobacteria bacterium]|nr:MAG: hypothetical protein D6757_07030 [Alphaproteobacteria bacterium]